MGYYDRGEARQQAAIASFSSRVYGWMGIGLTVTATIAYLLFATSAYIALLPLWWLWSIGLFGIAMAFNYTLPRISTRGAAGLFLAYSALEGVLFGTILPAFAAAFGGQVIWTAFATAAVIFTTAMIYGKITKNDLTAFGRILNFALIGLAAVTLLFFIVSFFLPMGFLNLILSYVGLGIFVGLTAYDAQTIRRYGLQSEGSDELASKLSLVMALKMYLNVIMIFWYLLQIFASSSSSGRR